MRYIFLLLILFVGPVYGASCAVDESMCVLHDKCLMPLYAGPALNRLVYKHGLCFMDSDYEVVRIYINNMSDNDRGLLKYGVVERSLPFLIPSAGQQSLVKKWKFFYSDKDFWSVTAKCEAKGLIFNVETRTRSFTRKVAIDDDGTLYYTKDERIVLETGVMQLGYYVDSAGFFYMRAPAGGQREVRPLSYDLFGDKLLIMCNGFLLDVLEGGEEYDTCSPTTKEDFLKAVMPPLSGYSRYFEFGDRFVKSTCVEKGGERFLCIYHDICAENTTLIKRQSSSGMLLYRFWIPWDNNMQAMEFDTSKTMATIQLQQLEHQSSFILQYKNIDWKDRLRCIYTMRGQLPNQVPPHYYLHDMGEGHFGAAILMANGLGLVSREGESLIYKLCADTSTTDQPVRHFSYPLCANSASQTVSSIENVEKRYDNAGPALSEHHVRTISGENISYTFPGCILEYSGHAYTATLQLALSHCAQSVKFIFTVFDISDQLRMQHEIIIIEQEEPHEPSCWECFCNGMFFGRHSLTHKTPFAVTMPISGLQVGEYQFRLDPQGELLMRLVCSEREFGWDWWLKTQKKSIVGRTFNAECFT